MPATSTLKLTSLSSCAGCAAKLGQEALTQVLRRIPPVPRDPKMLVGAATADDAGVYRLNANLALVQTVDFFTPIVDDPFTYALPAVLAIGEKKVVGSLLGSCNSLRDIPKLIALDRAGRLDLSALITARRPLAEINDALDDLTNTVGIRTVLDV